MTERAEPEREYFDKMGRPWNNAADTSPDTNVTPSGNRVLDPRPRTGNSLPGGNRASAAMDVESQNVESHGESQNVEFHSGTWERPVSLNLIAQRPDCPLSAPTLSSHRWNSDFPAPEWGSGKAGDPWVYRPSVVISWAVDYLRDNPHSKVMSDRVRAVHRSGAYAAGKERKQAEGQGQQGKNRAPDFTDPARALRVMIDNYEREITRLQGDIDRYDELIARARLALDVLQEGDQ